MSQAYEAGTARLNLSPYWGTFFQDVDARLRASRSELKVKIVPEGVHEFRAGLEAQLRSLRPTIKVGVDLDMGDLQSRLETRLAMMRPEVSVKADLDTSAAEVKMAAFREWAGRPIHINVDVDTSHGIAGVAALRASVQSLHAMLSNLPPIPPIPIPGPGGGGGGGFGGAGIGAASVAMRGLGAAAGIAGAAIKGITLLSLVPLIGQITKAAGALALIPAAAGAAAASISAIVIGSSGVKDAFEKGSEAAKNSAEEQEASAKAIEQAQRGVADAQKAVARTAEQGADAVSRAERGVADTQKASQRAQEDLTRARKDAQAQIEDLNLALKAASLSEEDAELSLREAAKRMREVQIDPRAGRDERDRANLSYRQAIQRLAEVRARNGDLQREAEQANQAGVEGAENVVAAKERIAEADQAAQDAQKELARTQRDAAEANAEALQRVADAQEALAEAQSSAGKSLDEYNKALENLSPAAREFVEMVRGLSGEWKSLRLEVQESLFSGLGAEVVNLSENLLPTFKTGLSGIATEINGGLKTALQDLGSESSKLDWTKILENTRLSIKPLMGGLSELLGAFQDIAAVGSEFLPGISTTFEETMKGFHEWTGSEEGQNSIRRFLETSLEKLREVKGLIVAAGDAIAGIFRTSDDAGKSMVQSMTDSLNSFAEWMKTADGDAKMKQFWDDVRKSAETLLKLAEKTLEVLSKFDKVASVFGLGSSDDPMAPGPAGAPGVNNTKGGRGRWDAFKDLVGDILLGDQSEPEPGQDDGFKLPGQRTVDGWGRSINRWLRNDNDEGFMRSLRTAFGTMDDPRQAEIDARNGKNARDKQLEEIKRKSDAGEELSAEESKILLESTQGGGRGRSIVRGPKSGGTDGGAGGGLSLFDPDSWRESWDGLTESVRDGWGRHIQPALSGLTARAGEIGGSFLTNVKNTATGAWDGLTSGVQDGWNTQIMPAWQALRTDGLGGLADHFTSKITNGAVTSWQDLPGKIGEGVGKIVTEHFPGLKTGIDKVSEFFAGLRDGIRRIWNDILSDVGGAVNGIIDLINWGVGGLWSKVDGFLGGKLPDWHDIAHVSWGGNAGKGEGPKKTVPGMETGGFVPLEPGTQWGKDGVLRVLAPGEFVFSKPAVDAAGVENLSAFNAAARGGSRPSTEGMFAMESGGRVTRDDPAWDAIRRGHDFVKAQDGKPYQWAGPRFVGDSFDCTGLVMAAAATILGQNPWQRYGYTGSFRGGQPGPLGFQPGKGAGLTIGIFDDPGGDGGGHAAGTLSGVEGLPDVNIESSGGEGVRYGRGARGASNSMFPWQFHLPIVDGAFVDPGPGGAGGGPTRDEQTSLVGRFIDGLLNPIRDKIREVIGAPPPELKAVPPALFDKMIDPVKDFIVEKTKALDVVVQGVADLKDAILSPVKSLGNFLFHRDTGGSLPPGYNLVLNETGKDEYVLNPEQWDLIGQLGDTARKFGPFLAAFLGTEYVPPSAEVATYADYQAYLAGKASGTNGSGGPLPAEAQATYDQYGDPTSAAMPALLATSPQMQALDLVDAYAVKGQDWLKQTQVDLIDDLFSPLGMSSVQVGTIVTQDVPAAMTRLQRIADMHARGYNRTTGR
ncbi:hypothetical protein [Rhodococcus sp. ACT016]|uniref:hypothetical protein n=1 Tax=Rhodococcus sp. ACT016 TaxID=3134808 RepID=UPI003D2B6161